MHRLARLGRLHARTAGEVLDGVQTRDLPIAGAQGEAEALFVDRQAHAHTLRDDVASPAGELSQHVLQALVTSVAAQLVDRLAGFFDWFHQARAFRSVRAGTVLGVLLRSP